MYPPTPLVTVLLLALLAQRAVCAPATFRHVSRDVEYTEVQQQLGLPQEQAQTSEQETISHEPLDALFPSSIDSSPGQAFTTPSRYYSTLLARRLLALSSTGVLTTVFPQNISDIPAYGRTPSDVAGISIGLPEYIADCEGNGNPTIIALGVSTSTKNVLYGDGEGDGKGRNVSLSVSWWEQYAKPENKGREAWSMANLPRVSLLGWLEEMSDEDVQEDGIEECFTSSHKDSRLWLPGSKFAAHQGKWARIVVEEIYWIGGFGGTNYIGWLEPREWRGVGDEWKDVRLRGETS